MRIYMKGIFKKLTLGLLLIVGSIITIVTFAIMGSSPVKAIETPSDTTGSKVDVWYQTYDATDYAIKANFSSIYGYDYATAKEQVDTYETYLQMYIDYGYSASDAKVLLDGMWNGDNIDTSAITASSAGYSSYPYGWWNTKSNTDLLGMFYFSLGTFNGQLPYVTRTGAGLPINPYVYSLAYENISGFGKTYEQVKASIDAYDKVEEKTEFEVGQSFVLLVYMQYDGLNNAALFYDNTFSGLVDKIESTMTSGVIASDSGLWTAGSYTGAYFSSITTGVTGATGGIKVGGQKSDATAGENAVSMIGGLTLTISSTATTGDHEIKFLRVNDTVVQNGAGTENQGSRDSANFNERTVKIKVKSSTQLKSAKIDYTDTFGSTTFNGAYQSVGSHTFTGDSDPTSYDLWKMDDIYTASNATNLGLTVDYESIAGTTIDAVSGLESSVSNALNAVHGTSSGSGTTSSPNISLAFNTPMYQALRISGKYYVVKFERKQYTDNKLTGFAFVQTDSALNPTKYILSPAFTAATTNYTIKVPADATTIDFTPTFDESLGTTAYLGSVAAANALTSTTTATGVTLGSSFTIIVKSQSGATNPYVFTVQTLSTDDTLVLTPSGTGLSVDTTASPTYVVNGLKYADNNFNFVPTTADGKAKITIGTGTADVKGTTQSFGAFTTALGYGAIPSGTQTIKIYVEAEASDLAHRKEYTITYTRAAADTTNTISSMTATQVGGTGAGGNITLVQDPADTTGMTYIASSGDLDYTATGYSITVNSADTTSIKINTAAAVLKTTSQTINFSGVNASTPTCDIVVTAEDGTVSPNTYHIKVTRKAADNDGSYSIVHIYGKDASGNTIYGYNGDTAVTVNAGFATSFKDKFGFAIDATSGDIVNANSLPTSVRNIVVKLKTTKSTTSLKFGGVNYNDVDYTFSVNFVTSAGQYTTENFAVATQADGSGTGTPHTLSVLMDAISTDSKLISVTTTGVTDTSVTNTKTFAIGATPPDTGYSYQMEATKNSQYTLNIVKSSAKSKVYYSTNINDFTGAVGSSTFTALEYTNGSTLNINAYNSTNRLYLCVVAEADGVGGASYRTNYTIDVRYTDTRSSNATINDIKVYGIDNLGNSTVIFNSFNSAAPTQSAVTVNYSTVQLRFEVTFDDSTATLVSGWGITNMANMGIHSIVGGVDTSNTYTIQAVAENTTTTSTEYKIPITRKAPKTGQAITSLTLNGATYDDSNATSFVFGLNRGVLTPVLALTVSDGAIYSITTPGGSSYNTSGNTMDGLQNGMVTSATITVTSEKVQVDGGAPKTYTVYFINADKTNVIDNIQILSKDEFGSDLKQDDGSTYVYNSGVDTIPFTIPYKSENPYFKVTHSTTPNSVIAGDGAQTVAQNATSPQNKLITVTSTSEYGKLLGTISGYTVPTTEVLTYKYNFTRLAASTVNTLSNLNFTFSGSYTTTTPTSYTTEASINAIPNPLKFENLTNTPSVTISFTKTDPNSVVTISGIDPFTDPMATTGAGTTTQTLNMVVNATSYVTLTCTPESGGAPKQWTFAFAYSTVTLDNNGDTKKITLEGDVSSGDILGFSPTTNPYSVHLSGKNTMAKIIVTPDSSLSTVTVDGNAYTLGSVYTKSLTPGNTENIKVVVTAQNGVDHSEYDIEIICDALSEDATLLSVKTSKFDGANWSTPATLAGFDKDNPTYEINVTNDITQFKIEPYLNNAKATIAANTANPGNLQVGTNNFTVTVLSEAYDPANPNPAHMMEYKFTVIRDDKVELEDARFMKVGEVTNLIDFSDPSSYTFNIPYSNDKLDLSFQTKGKSENLKVVVKNVTTNKVIAVTVADDGTGAEISTGTTDTLVEGQNTITIRIEAKSGDYKLYTFKVTRATGDANNYITSYTGEDGNTYGTLIDVTTVTTKVVDSSKTIEYVLPRTYVDRNYEPTITVVDGVPALPDGKYYEIVAASMVLAAGKNTFQIKVTAENGTPRLYNVVVYVVDQMPTVQTLTLTDTNGKNDYFTYSDISNNYPFNVAYSVNSGTLEVKLDSSFAKVKVDGTEMSSNNAGKYTTTLDLSATKVFTIVIESELYQYKNVASEKKQIQLDMTKDPANTDTSLKELKLMVGTQTYELIKTDASGNVIVITPVENMIQVSGDEFVVANVGDSVSSFTVKATPNKQFPATNLSGLTYSADKTYGQSSPSFATNSTNHSISFAVYDEANENPRTFTITVYRGDPVKPEDNNNVKVELVDSSNIKYIGDSVFSQSQTLYKLGSSAIKAISYGKNKTYTITAIKDNGSLAKLYIDNSEVGSFKQFIVDYPREGVINERSFVVATGADADYYYSFSNVAATASNYTSYYFFDTDIQKYVAASLLPEYDSTLHYYSKSIVSKSSVNSSNYSNFFVSDTDYVAVHTVYAKSQNGIDGTVYTIYVVAKAATADATLKDIKKDGTTIDSFSPKESTYNLGEFGNTPTSVRLYAITTDENATVSVTLTNDDGTKTYPNVNDTEYTFDLATGYNTFTYLVTAEDGTTTNPYTVKYYRQYPNPELIDLKLDEYTFYSDSALKFETLFAGDVNQYYTKVNYGDDRVIVTCKLEDATKNYDVTPSGNATAISNSRGSIVRTFYVYPQVGMGSENRYTFTVTSNNGLTTPYTIWIKRNSEITASTDIATVNEVSTGTIPQNYEQLLLDDGGNKVYESINDLGNDLLKANNEDNLIIGPYLLPNDQTSLDIKLDLLAKVRDPNTNATYQLINNKDLPVGDNVVVLKITSDDKQNTQTILVNVHRLDYEYDIESPTLADFDQDNIQETYTVPAETSKVEFNVTNANPARNIETTYRVINGEGLKFGNNEVAVEITSYRKSETDPTQKVVDDVKIVKINVERENYDANVVKKTADLTAEDMIALNTTKAKATSPTRLLPSEEAGIKIEDSDRYLAAVTVPSNIANIGAEVISLPGFEDGTIKVLNGNLSVGENEVTFLLTSKDGLTTKEYTVLVNRGKMKFNVVTPDEKFTISAVASRDNFYTMNLGHDPATIIADYTKAITFDNKTDDLTVELLTDVTNKTNEVVLKITNNQNTNEVEYVHLQLDTTATTGGSVFDILFWIILGITIVILTIILICVNRDKYGAISKKRKNA